LSTFLVAWLSIVLNHAKTTSNYRIAFLVPSSLEMPVLKSFKAFRN
jgi:hypothetical protein